MEDFDRPQSSRQAEASKAFLMKNSSNSNMNLYDHLTQLLTKVMDEHPNNAVDVFEEMSYEVKRASLNSMQSNLRDLPQLTATELLAEQQRSLFLQSDNEPLEDETGKPVLPNVSEISFYLEQAEVGLGREEMQRIFLALKKLVDSERLTHCRFWGKILGIENNYIVAEAENREGEEKDHYTIEDELKEQIKESPLGGEEPPFPHSAHKPQHEVPKEAIGIGANKFAYYVCKEPGLPWVKIPSVTPAQITIARQIRKFFTGNLDKSVVSYPPFPGNEANYLRAQIARISAATQVSPYGFYQTVGDEGEEEQELYWASIEVNPDFEGVPVRELAESLKVWVHHRQHILQQGRCTWENMAEKTGEDTNEETEDEREEELDEPEVGPRLLNPLSLDAGQRMLIYRFWSFPQVILFIFNFSFPMKVKFTFHLEIKLHRKNGEAQSSRYSKSMDLEYGVPTARDEFRSYVKSVCFLYSQLSHIQGNFYSTFSFCLAAEWQSN
uniref:Radial spoke head component 4A n=1 Tax=Cyprinodon variegatus TaxID=28743 RepID=A0A3Q2CR95_CYPVA